MYILLSVKKCQAPDLPNGYTYVTPSKEEYECGESVKVECNDCYKVGGLSPE